MTLRLVLYLYVLLVACPVRYWPLVNGIDETWRFAINYAHAMGMETIFTTGPLGFLMFPQHIGSNLSEALLFQIALWVVLALIFADLFFRCGFPVRTLALFALCFGLSAPLFWQNFFGIENLILAAALLLLTMFHLQGRWIRYFAAVGLIAFLPLLKMTAALIGAAALAGFLLDFAIRNGRRVIRPGAIALVVPSMVICTALLLLHPSFSRAQTYLRGTSEMMSGYTGGMSLAGPVAALLAAITAVAAFLLFLYLAGSHARFFALLLTLPLFISFKHGFVRAHHSVDFFCFTALAIAVTALSIRLRGKAAWMVAASLTALVAFGGQTIAAEEGPQPTLEILGIPGIHRLWGALWFHRLENQLDSSTNGFKDDEKLEAQVVDIIGKRTVAAMSMNFTNLALAGTRLAVYPVMQRYAAYTPYLDDLNARWIRDEGPDFLVFDGASIDERDAWAETPAMWREVYRWYDTRLLGARNLLLERRATPRFNRLATVARFRISFPGELRFPEYQDDLFWTLDCEYSGRGKLLNLLFRDPEVTMRVNEGPGPRRLARLVPAVLTAPVLGNHLPGTLAQFADVFKATPGPVPHVIALSFASYSPDAYGSECGAELFRPVASP